MSEEYETEIADIQSRFWALIDAAVPKGDPIGFAEPPHFALIRDAIALARSEHAEISSLREQLEGARTETPEDRYEREGLNDENLALRAELATLRAQLEGERKTVLETVQRVFDEWWTDEDAEGAPIEFLGDVMHQLDTDLAAVLEGENE